MTEQDLVERLALECLARLERGEHGVVEIVCAEHPEHVGLVRKLLDKLGDVGLVSGPAPSAPRAAGLTVGDFRLVERLGGGGMGEVWLADQISLPRRVALKLMRAPFGATRRARERFAREVAALARLEHERICPVYGAGEADGMPYLAMRAIDGEPLSRWIERARSGVRGTSEEAARVAQAALWIEKVAEAVHHAHERGFVHRDLKPGNVMLTPGSEPVLLDFGLAHALEGDARVTLSGDTLGTPLYMAPEQVEGRVVDRRTDVYGLGAMLYEAVTLRCPHESESREALYQAILRDEAPSARSLNRAVPGDLSTVIQCSLEKDPRRRYETAQALADDLGRIRRREPIRARPPGALLRLVRWTQRNRLASAIVLLTSAGLVVALLLLETNRRTRVALQALGLAHASGYIGRERPRLAFQLGREALRRDASPEVLEQVQAAMGELHELAVTDAKSGALEGLRCSPDGQRILVTSQTANVVLLDGQGKRLPDLALPSPTVAPAIAFAPNRRELAVGCGDRTVRCFDFEGVLVRELPAHPRPSRGAVSICYSPDGKDLVVGYGSGTARLWPLDAEKPHELVGHRGQVASIAFAPDGSCFVTADRPGLIELQASAPTSRPDPRTEPARALCIWRRDGTLVKRIEISGDGITKVACSNARVASVARNGALQLFTLQGEPVGQPHAFEGDSFNDVEFDADGRRLVAVSKVRRTIVLAASDGRLIDQWTRKGTAPDVEISSRGHLATAGWDGSISVSDWQGSELVRLKGHTNGVYAVAWMQDGERLASVSWDGTLRIWQLSPLAVTGCGGFDLGVVRMKAMPDRQRVVVGSRLGQVAVLDAGGKVWRSRLLGSALVLALHACADGRRVLVVTEDGRARLWETTEDRIVAEQQLPGLLLEGAGAGQLPDGRLLIGLGCVVYAWDPERGAPTPLIASADPNQHRGVIMSIDVDRTGTRLLTASLDATVRLWTAEGKFLRVLEGHEVGLQMAAFSADGKRVLTASEDGTARIFDCDTGLTLVTITGHQAGIRAISWSPDGTEVLTGSMDSTARLWDARTGALKLVLRGHASGLQGVLFAADGRAITASWDGTVRWWWLRAEDLRSVAENVGIEELSAADRVRFAPLLGK